MAAMEGTASRRPSADVLLERDRELAPLDALVDGAAAGEAGLVVVEGPAGIGKSRLLAAARERRRRRLHVLRARHGARARLPVRRGAPAVRAAARRSASSGARVRGRGAAGAAGVRAGVRRRRRAGGRVVRRAARPVLADRSTSPAEAPVALLVDDLHWADRAVAALPGLPGAASRGPADPARRGLRAESRASSRADGRPGHRTRHARRSAPGRSAPRRVAGSSPSGSAPGRPAFAAPASRPPAATRCCCASCSRRSVGGRAAPRPTRPRWCGRSARAPSRGRAAAPGAAGPHGHPPWPRPSRSSARAPTSATSPRWPGSTSGRWRAASAALARGRDPARRDPLGSSTPDPRGRLPRPGRRRSASCATRGGRCWATAARRRRGAAQLLQAPRRGDRGWSSGCARPRGRPSARAVDSAVAYLERALEEPRPPTCAPYLLLELAGLERRTNGGRPRCGTSRRPTTT